MRPRIVRTAAALLLGLAGTAPAVLAAGTVAGPAARRPRVALVLGGGGARGCAHIGVLKVLEELRVPVDLIAGTSMGSLVGGLYASGLSPERIEDAVTTADWGDLFDDEVARPGWSFQRKLDSRRYLGGEDIGFSSWRFLMPQGLIVGQKLNLLLRANTLNVATVTDFDRLPIPYRAIATDIGDGEAVVMGDGDLVQAIRASISIPGVFSPVERDGRLLVDGGLVDNVPVDVARALGAEVVIAVDVGGRFTDAAKLVNALKISRQVMSMLSRKNANVQLAAADIVITPDLAGFAAADFAKGAAIIPRGEAAARAAIDLLRPLAVDEESWKAWLELQRARPLQPITIDSLQVEGAAHVEPRRVTGLLRTRPGHVLDPQQLAEDLMALHALGYFQQVDYRLVADRLGTGLIIVAREKPWGPNYLRFNLGLRDDFEGGASYTFVVNHTATLVNPLGAEWRNDIQFGRVNRFTSEFYQPLTARGVWFAATGAEVKREPFDLYAGGTRVAGYLFRTAGAEVDVGAALGQWGETRLGFWRGRLRGERRLGDPQFENFTLNGAAVTASVRADTLDAVDFPTRGVLASVEASGYRHAFGGEYSSNRLAVDVGGWTSHGRQTCFGQLFAGGNGDVQGAGLPGFFIGGLGSLSGFNDGELYGDYAAVLRLGTYRAIGRLPGSLGGKVIVGGWVEAGNAWFERQEVSTRDLHKTVTAIVGAETVLGPVSFAIGTATGGGTRVYVSLGRAR